MKHKLMAVLHVEVDPVRSAAAFGAAECVAVKAARFGKVSDLDGDMKRCETPRTDLPAWLPVPPPRRRAVCAVAAVGALWAIGVAASAQAATDIPEPPPTFLSVGPAVEVTPSYPGAKTQRTFALPDFEGQYDNWLYISGTDLVGAYAYNHQGNKAGAAIMYDFTQRLQDDSRQLGPLKDVDPTLRFKLFIEQRVAMFAGGLRAATDIGGHDEGTVAQAYLNLLLPLTAHGFLTLGPGVTWSDSHYMRAFYSVSAAQSEISGLPQFDAHQGVSDLYAELVAGYEFSSRWAIGLDVIYAHLQGDAADSPFTESRAQTTWFASILYKFK
jgi:outer membrane scaffolding protein for murein synthesis (MipA/OmpV family)